MTNISSELSPTAVAETELDQPTSLDTSTELGSESLAEPERLIYRHLLGSAGRGRDTSSMSVS